MPNLQLVPDSVVKYMQDTWSLYASETRGNKLVRFWFNGVGALRITESEAGSGKDERVVLETFNRPDSLFSTMQLESAVDLFNTL